MKKKFLTTLILTCILLAGCGKNTETSIPAAQESTVAIAEETVTAPEAESTQESQQGSAEASSLQASTDKTDDKDEAKEAASESSTEPAKDKEANVQPEPEPQTESEPQPEQPAPEAQPEKKDYGHIVFVGDSRTVDIFDGEGYEVFNLDINGVKVYAENGQGCDYLKDIMRHIDYNCDTVITWLGCNDHYNIEQYKAFYDELLSKNINLVICNVGPTVNECLDEWDSTRYRNEDMVAFNEQITAWANAHGVKVIDMYSYVNSNLQIDADGIHYSPKPTSAVWSYIMGSL